MKESTPMTMTPQEIQSKQFHVRMRGFDVEEVDAFLEKIAEEFLILTLESKQYLQKIEGLEKDITSYKSKETAFQQAIMSAQKISAEMQDKSKAESEQIIANARQEAEELQRRTGEEVNRLQAEANEAAEKIQADAAKTAAGLKVEINELSTLKDKIQNDLRQLLQNYLKNIDDDVPEGLLNLEVPTVPAAATIAEPATQVPAQESVPELPPEDMSDLYERIELIEETAPEVLSIEEEIAPEPVEETLESVDLGDLTLNDNEEQIELPAMDTEPVAEISLPALDDNGELDEELTIPEIDGDMLFSLEDPLDDLGPAVSIADDEKS